MEIEKFSFRTPKGVLTVKLDEKLIPTFQERFISVSEAIAILCWGIKNNQIELIGYEKKDVG